MKTILTDDERNQIIDSMGWRLDAQERGDMHRLIQAVLTKLAQQAAAPEAQETADVWHEGSQSFYRAVLLKKLTLDEVFFDPAGSPEAPAQEKSNG